MEEAIQSIRNGDNHLSLLTLGELGHFSSAGRMITEHSQDLHVLMAKGLQGDLYREKPLVLS